MTSPSHAAPRSGAGADRLFGLVTAGAAWLVLILLGAAAASMAWGGRLAFERFGWGFVTSSDWDAVAGKFGASTLAARMAGMDWRESAAIGVLMNTRGLMELVILNVGLEIGVISPALFAIMVVMALVSTVMTTPLLEWIYPPRLVPAEAPVRITSAEATARETSVYSADSV